MPVTLKVYLVTVVTSNMAFWEPTAQTSTGFHTLLLPPAGMHTLLLPPAGIALQAAAAELSGTSRLALTPSAEELSVSMASSAGR